MVEEEISAWVVSKYVSQTQQVCVGALMSYDKSMEILLTSEDGDPLLGSIWRNIFEGDLDMNRAHLVMMREYVLTEMERLKELDPAVLLSGKVAFSSPPTSLPSPELVEEAESLPKTFASGKMFDGQVQMTWSTA